MQRRQFIGTLATLALPRLLWAQTGVARFMPSYAGFIELEELFGKRGMKKPDIDGILGGNYIRVLREAMAV